VTELEEKRVQNGAFFATCVVSARKKERRYYIFRAWDREFYYSYVRCLDLLVENKLSAHELTKGAVLSLDEFFV